MNTKQAYLHQHKEEIISLYVKQRKSAKFIATKFSLSKDTVYAYLKLWGVTIRKNTKGWDRPVGHNRWYARNSDYFSYPTEENSYWAGFIASDGNITDYGSVRVALDERDIESLENLKNCLQFTGEIKKYKYTRDKPGNYVRLEVVDPLLVSFLETYWSITPRKTKTLQPPQILREELIRAFIIGYIDGDGSISNNGTKQVIQICGTLELLTWIKNQLIKYCGCEFKNNIYKSRNIYTFTLSGTNVWKFYEWCKTYKEYRMKRKWDKLKDRR